MSEKCPDGVIVINKHEGVTSFRIIQIIRRMFNTKKVGHTGTLDPMATGVLPVLIGRGVKACDFLTAEDKHYIATLRLGLTTDTEDITGNVISRCSKIPDEESVFETLSSFTGEISQIPPMYSAVKINGRKLVDIARKGETIERSARKINIYSLKGQKLEDSLYRLDIKCSKGTYIRTLCADIGEKLGCGGVMASLERVGSGSFNISEAHSVDELEALSQEELYGLVVPLDRLFTAYTEVKFEDFFTKLALSGNEIYLKKINTELPVGEIVRMADKNGFFALGRVEEFERGAAVRPIKQFRI